jgi:hypothetical protein
MNSSLGLAPTPVAVSCGSANATPTHLSSMRPHYNVMISSISASVPEMSMWPLFYPKRRIRGDLLIATTADGRRKKAPRE